MHTVHAVIKVYIVYIPAETPELAVSVLVRTSMEEAGRPREAAIARIITENIKRLLWFV